MTPPKNWLLFPPKIRSAHLQALHDENDDSWSWYYVFLLNILYIYTNKQKIKILVILQYILLFIRKKIPPKICSLCS